MVGTRLFPGVSAAAGWVVPVSTLELIDWDVIHPQ